MGRRLGGIYGRGRKSGFDWGGEGVTPGEVGGGFVEGVFLGDVRGFDSGVDGGDCEVYACFCFVWLVEEAAPDRGGLRESGEGGVGEFGFFPARGGFFGDALELGALEALREVAPVMVG